MNYSLSRFTIVSSLVCLGFFCYHLSCYHGNGKKTRKKLSESSRKKECETGQRLLWLFRGIFFNAWFMEGVVFKWRPIFIGREVLCWATLPYKIRKFGWKFCDREGEGSLKISVFCIPSFMNAPEYVKGNFG